MTFVGSDDIHALLVEDVMTCNIPNQQTCKSLNVLLKVVQNIRENPDEEKFRHLKKNNQVIAPLLDLIAVKDLLSSIGFEEAPETWDYEPTDESYKIIQKVYTMLNGRVGSMEVIGQIDPKIQKIVQESKKKFEQEKEYKRKLVEQIEKDRRQWKEKNSKKIEPKMMKVNQQKSTVK